MMKVLVTGASGLLGRQVYKELLSSTTSTSNTTTGTTTSGAICGVVGTRFSRIREGDNLVSVDLTQTENVRKLIKEHAPDVVVHCAAERRPDVVEKDTDKAENLNVGATENLCALSNETGAWVLYLSTDYVFDGTSAPYGVTDPPNPLNNYGRMKLAGEKKVLESNSKNAVLRVPILYGPVEYLGESAVTVLFDKVRDATKPCKMDHRQKRYPTHTACVSQVIRLMIEKHADQKGSVSGIYHFSEPAMMTKYDMAVKMADGFSLDASHIEADTTEPPAGSTPRPYDCQLDTSRLTSEGIALPTMDFAEAIKSVLAPYYP